MVKSKPSHKSFRRISFGLLMVMAILLLLSQKFDEVKGEEHVSPSSDLPGTNALISQITHINEELLRTELSPQMRTSLTEKLVLLENYADAITSGERTAAKKDDGLFALAPEANNPPFQEGIFHGGEHLLREQTFLANNYLQLNYKGNYLQIVAGKNFMTLSGSLFVINTAADRMSSETIEINTSVSVHDLTITSFEGDRINLMDQDNRIYLFDLISRRFYPEN